MKAIGERLLRLPEVLKRVPFWKTTLYRLQSERSFPQGMQLVSNMVVWVASDKDITNLDDFNQVVDWENSSFYQTRTENLNKT